MILFNSWQSDLPGNRNLIDKCLRQVADAVDIKIESATRGAKGSPDIAATILTKIDEADIFLADVSIINPAIVDGRKTPNPNVLYELGYAFKALGQDNIILVANVDTTQTADLPFDIRNRRMVLVSFEDSSAKNVIVKAITSSLISTKPKANLPEVPKIVFVDPFVKWANWGTNTGVFTGFQALLSLDNYKGESDYITNVEFTASNADSTEWKSTQYKINQNPTNKLFPVPPDNMEEIVVLMSDDSAGSRLMPDLDRDSGKITISFKSGKKELLNVKAGHLAPN